MQREGREYWGVHVAPGHGQHHQEKILDQHTANVWKAAQESMIKDVHKKFPVPDMEHVEMWPHDEQIRWEGIGEVISYLNSKV